jgi:hypothetical protein
MRPGFIDQVVLIRASLGELDFHVHTSLADNLFLNRQQDLVILIESSVLSQFVIQACAISIACVEMIA